MCFIIYTVRTIHQVISVRSWSDQFQRTHYKSYVLLDNGEEATGYGQFKAGEQVEVYFSDKWDEVQVKRPKKKGGAVKEL